MADLMATPLPPTPYCGSVTGFLGSWDSWVPGFLRFLGFWRLIEAAGGCWRLLEAAGGVEVAFSLVIIQLTGFKRKRT